MVAMREREQNQLDDQSSFYRGHADPIIVGVADLQCRWCVLCWAERLIEYRETLMRGGHRQMRMDDRKKSVYLPAVHKEFLCENIHQEQMGKLTRCARQSLGRLPCHPDAKMFVLAEDNARRA